MGKPVSERDLSVATKGGNRGAVFMAPGKVEIKDIDFPKLELDSSSSPVASERQGPRKCEHGVILKVTTTNICGSDQHMVRATSAALRSAPAAPAHRRR
jgi:glutathione-independent formaldehyde dehydrogenase